MENEEKKEVQGRPWKNEAKFKNYQEAEQFRLELENSDNPPAELKIKHLSSSGLFVVKSRNKKEKSKKQKK